METSSGGAAVNKKNRTSYNMREMADFARAEAESELSAAKKTVKELTRRIEELYSRVKVQVRDMEKMRIGTRKEAESNLTVKEELELIKRELSKLKLDMAVTMEEKRRAEEEADSLLETDPSISSVEALNKEIEETNEEHVLVELARIEAVKEYQEIEAQRREETARYSAAIAETRKKKYQMIQQINAAKGLEEKLAIALSDINMLHTELKQIREMQTGIGRDGIESNNHDSGQESESSLEALRKELDNSRKQLGSIEAEAFQFMVSMDAARNELRSVAEESARLRKKEEKTEMNIQNLNLKLLSANMRLEAKSTAEDKSRSVLSNLLLHLEQLKSETTTAQKERSKVIEETVGLGTEIQRTEMDIELAEEQLQYAVQELITVKSSEAIALENLKALSEKTVRDRADISRIRSKITISKFEYEYLKGRAAESMEIAEKKVAAAQAWTETVKASEKEIQITLSLGRETRELRVEEKSEDPETEESTKTTYEFEDEFERWRERMKPENKELQTALSSKGMNRRSIKTTPPRRGKARRSVSRVVCSTRRSTSVGRRTEAMPNLSNLFSGKSTESDQDDIFKD